MEIEISEVGKMSQSGSSLLNLIQNNDLPILDLLVREAVQNSLDAGIEVKGYNSIYVDIGIKNIEVSKFSRYLNGITDQLNKKFGHSLQKAIYIEDTHTTGLTGTLDFQKNVNSNIFKLIYGISMAQDAPGSGGSWGLGKTIYFRIGIGLVVYYSRILNENGFYEERLAITLVENEKLSDTIIPKCSNKNSNGIAWWGQRINQNSDDTIPITDKVLIQEILSSLTIKPFGNEEIGTKIIIPFIDEDRLLIKHETNPHENKPWESNVAECIKIAMQRWYAPRLANPKFLHGKYLDGHVNGERINQQSFLPIFYEVQKMYNEALNDKHSERYYVEHILVRNHFEHDRKGNAGKVVYKKFTSKELAMMAPHNNSSPFACADKANPSFERNAPLIAYTRKPGMIVNYETAGEWCKGIDFTEKNEYLIGIFVPNSSIKFKSIEDGIIDLEAYLRKSEMADHTSWNDLITKNKPFDVLKKIRRQLQQKIITSLNNKDLKQEIQVTNKLARSIGKMLLPPSGYGRRAYSQSHLIKQQTSGYVNGASNSFKILAQRYMENNILELDFQLKLIRNIKTFIIELYVSAEGGRIAATDWESIDKVGTPFPTKIIAITFCEEAQGQLFKDEKLISDSKVWYGNSYQKQNKSLDCFGKISFLCNDPYLQVEISMKPEGGA